MFQPQQAVCGCEISALKYTHLGSVCMIILIMSAGLRWTEHRDGPFGDVMLLCSYCLWQWRERRQKIGSFTVFNWLWIASSVSRLLKTVLVLFTWDIMSIHLLYSFLLSCSWKLSQGKGRACYRYTTGHIFHFLLSITILDWLLFNRWINVHTTPPGGLVWY